MKFITSKVACLLLFLWPLIIFSAVPIAPVEIKVEQPGGFSFSVFPKGNIAREWVETHDGYAVQKVSDKWFYLNRGSDGVPVLTNLEVGLTTQSDLLSLAKANSILFEKRGLTPSEHESLSITPRQNLNVDSNALNKNHFGGLQVLHSPSAKKNGFYTLPSRITRSQQALSFTQNILVIRVAFNNQAFKYDAASFEQLMFSGNNSVKNFFLKASHDNYTIVGINESEGTANDGIVSITLNMDHPNSKYGSTAMIQGAIAAADPYVNYSSFDANSDGYISAKELSIVMIVAGYENAYGGDAGSLQPRVWGHKSSTSAVTHDGVTLAPYTMFGERHATSLANEHQATIGIMAHELGHLMLGLPDLYDIDGSSSGVGSWGLMGGGSWNYISGYSGSLPANMLSWSKAEVNFTSVEDVSSGAVSISSTTLEQTTKRVWIDKYKLGEHFLLENRTNDEYDRGLPNHGLIITHIDQTQTNNANDARRLVDIEEADGSIYAGSQSVFPGTGPYVNFNDTTTPNSKDNSSTSSNIAINNISISNNIVNIASLTAPSVNSNGYITYIDNGSSVSALGYSKTSAWTAIRYTNSTNLQTVDGIQVHAWGVGSADLYLYNSISNSGSLGNLLYTQLNNPLDAGYSRIFLNAPQSLSPNDDVVVVLKITLNSSNFPMSFNAGDTNYSGRSFVRSGDSGSFSSSTLSGYGDLAQYLLLSGSNDFDNDGIPDDSDPDDDNDGMPDSYEEVYGFNPKDASDATSDFDSDGLTNYQEYLAGTHPKDNDTDGDGTLDGQDSIPNGVFINTSVNGSGNISPTQIEINKGDSTQFMLTPAKGYKIGTISGCAGVQTQNTYTVSSTSNCTVSVGFVVDLEFRKAILSKLIPIIFGGEDN